MAVVVVVVAVMNTDHFVVVVAVVVDWQHYNRAVVVVVVDYCHMVVMNLDDYKHLLLDQILYPDHKQIHKHEKNLHLHHVYNDKILHNHLDHEKNLHSNIYFHLEIFFGKKIIRKRKERNLNLFFIKT